MTNVEAPTSARHERAWQRVTGEPKVRRVTVVAWTLLLLVLLVWVGRVVAYDYDVGESSFFVLDEPTFIFQTQSLAGSGHNLSFDQADLERWSAMSGTDVPPYLIFRERDEGWAFAKPYGFSLLAAPSVAIVGAVRGIAVTNAFLLVLLVAVCVAMLRLRYRGPIVPLTAGAFCLLAQPILFAFVAQPELFLCTASSVALLLVMLFARTHEPRWAVGALAVMGAVATERPPLLAMFVPLALVVVLTLPDRRWRLRAIGAAAVMWLVATVPYVYYSDGSSWNAYGGDRYGAIGAFPFDRATPAPPTSLIRLDRGEYFSPAIVVDALVDHPLESARSFFDYFVGRDTGMLVFLPTGCLLLVFALLRVRRFDRWAWGVASGIAGFVLLHVIVFPRSYAGGFYGGNRYFLHVAPALIALVVAAKLSARQLLVGAAVGSALSLAFLWPQLVHPRSAHFGAGQRVEASWLRCQLPKEPELRVPGDSAWGVTAGLGPDQRVDVCR